MTQPFNPPYEGATLEQLKNENVQQLLYLHSYLRNELRMMLRLIEEWDEETAEIDQALIQSLIRSGSHYAQHLHAHHQGETALMFPLLKRQGLAAETVERLNREHDALGVLIDAVTAGLMGMKTADLPKISADLHQLGEVLRSHLDYEESHVCPLLTHWSTAARLYGDLFRGQGV